MQIVYFSQSSFSHLGSDRNLVKLPVAVVSESSDHSRIAALTCIDFVIKDFVIKKIIMWNDDRAAQFRSPFVFKLLANYRRELQLEGNYNKVQYSKDTMDVIRAATKKCGI